MLVVGALVTAATATRIVLGLASVCAGRGRLWHPRDHCALCGVSISQPRAAHERLHAAEYALPILRARLGLRDAPLAAAVGDRYREMLRLTHADVVLERARQARAAADLQLDQARALDRGVEAVRAAAAAEVETARQYEREAHSARRTAEEHLERALGPLGAELVRLGASTTTTAPGRAVTLDRFELLDMD